MELSRDVDIAEISKLTSGFSGADLKAVIYEARLLSNHEKSDNITQENVLAAIPRVKPSLSAEELNKFNTM